MRVDEISYIWKEERLGFENLKRISKLAFKRERRRENERGG